MRKQSNTLRAENILENTNFLERITFLYTIKIYKKAWRANLTNDDLTEPLKDHCASLLGGELLLLWTNEVNRAEIRNRKPKLYRPLIKLFKKTILKISILTLIMEIFVKVSVPILLKMVLKYYSSDNEEKLKSGKLPHNTYLWRILYMYEEHGPISRDEAVFFTVALVIFNWLIIAMNNPYMMEMVHLGMKMRVACCSLIYRKALRLKLELASGQMIGNVITLLSNDAHRFDLSVLFMPYTWLAPLQTIIVSYFLYKEAGMAGIYGIISLISISPFLIFLAMSIQKIRFKCASVTDGRMKQMNELIQSIQAIKMYTWESIFFGIISKNRKREVGLLKRLGFIKGALMSFIIFLFRFSIFVVCISYSYNGGSLDAEKAFVITAYFLVLQKSVTIFLPQALALGSELAVSMLRMENFLSLNERESTLKKINHKTYSAYNLKIIEAFVRLDGKELLKNINLRILPYSLTAVIGPVGSGKSNLLHLILGELTPDIGKVEVNGSISYASQEPWIFPGSIRENILFGQEFNRSRYEEVCSVCALNTDFTLMPRRDNTLIGEKGCLLSGGQKARINLARAIYRDADIYLLDDPLSAVDTHVGRHLFDRCIRGYLVEKIVILVTHNLQFLEKVNEIILMKDGEIEAIGDYNNVIGTGPEFSEVIIEQIMGAGKPTETNEAETEIMSELLEKESRHSQQMTKRTSLAKGRSPSISKSKSSQMSAEIPQKPHLKLVKNDTYFHYFNAGSGFLGNLLMFSLFIFTQVFASSSDSILSFWIEGEEKNGESSRNFYVTIYSGLILATVVVSLIRSFHFFQVCLTASRNLHNSMFKSVIETTMHIFNIQGSGVILNLFSRDLGVIDELLPNTLMDTIQILLNLFGIFTVLSVVNPYFLIPTFILVFFFYAIRRCYLIVSNNIKRLESISRSPVYGHIHSTLLGLPTIRSSKTERILTHEFDRNLDMHSSAWFMFISTAVSFGYWLDTFCIIYIAAVTCSFLFNAKGSNDVGLAITQTMQTIGLLQWGVHQSAEMANQMVSVERVLEYSNLEPEANLVSDPSRAPPEDWPTTGKVEFSNIFMKYGLQDKTHVLRNVSFVIQDKEKIGVVGRTGAGKSSLFATMFRLAYYYGEVRIDDMDISQMCLHDLRRRISIIPQTPVLFSGTLRSNLDPFDEFDTNTILKVLIDLEIRDAATNGRACLQRTLVAGGGNMSAGEKQIICLARALLQNNRIIMMDEATANIDSKTDKLIQFIIRTKFSNSTVIMIAHRLHTIMDSDKILVIDAGRVMEYDHPHILLKDPKGTFTGMVERTGKHMAANLRAVAENNYLSKNAPSPSDETQRK